MVRSFYRSLDREIQILGLKGRWVRIFLVAFALSVLFAFITGGLTSMGVGLVIFFIGIIASFLVCLVMQGRIPSRQFDKIKLNSRCALRVIRSESISRILTEDPRYEKAQRMKGTAQVNQKIN